MKMLKYLVMPVIIGFILPHLAFGQVFFTGDGGSAIGVVIERPVGEALAADDEFALDFIQNILQNNFTKYTAVKASAQINDGILLGLENILILTTNLNKVGNTFALRMTAAHGGTASTQAFYFAQNILPTTILNAQAINEGFLSILQQLNVTLTDEGISSVRNPSADEVQAALNLARGNMAERRGNPIEMLTYLYNAAAYNPGMLEAGNRFDVLSQMLAAGDTGQAIGGDLQTREQWKEILDEFDRFYNKHPPFTLTYNPLPSQRGHTDYDNRTAMMQFEASFHEDVSFNAMQEVFTTLTTGLRSTGNQTLWGFATRPYRSPLFSAFRYYSIKAELVNVRDEVVATETFRVRSRIFLLRDKLYADTTQKLSISFKPIRIGDELTENMVVRITSIDDIETEKAMQDGYVKIVPSSEIPRDKIRNLLVLITRNVF